MDFLRLMFKYTVSRFPKQPSEYSLTSISNAIFALQQCSGIKRENLCKRLGLTRAKMIHLETYGKAPQSIIVKLKKISAEYELFELSHYFENQILLIQAHKRKSMRETTGR
jgi:hypothetical protein